MTSLKANASLNLRRDMVDRTIRSHFRKWIISDETEFESFVIHLREDLEKRGLLIYSPQRGEE